MSAPSAETRARLEHIRLLGLDVDGVLTDGSLVYGDRGETTKTFHARDGMGIRLLLESGVEVAVISGRDSPVVAKRIAELGIRHYFPKREDKRGALNELLSKLSIAAEDVAFIGDDVLDLSALRSVGVAITVADGHAYVKEEAHWITDSPGGKGAVREVADEILSCQGKLRRMCEKLLSQSDEELQKV